MLYGCDIPEAHSSPRQFLPPTFLPNGNVDVIRTKTILELGLIAGHRVGSILMDELHDIDTPGTVYCGREILSLA
jgi:hypothetical protein